MDTVSAAAAERYAALVRSAPRLVVGLDFDGTLAPIVDDPDLARIHPEAPDVLVRLGSEVLAMAVVTGRPATQVLALGGLAGIGKKVSAAGGELLVLGQYGNERWTSADPRVVSPPAPDGLAGLVADLPQILGEAGVPDAVVEEKGLAVAVHTRRLTDPQAAYDALLPALTGAAASRGLVVESGRMVLELRAPGMDKGQAVRSLVADLRADAVVFAGDDLGDLEAFRAVAELRESGLATFLVCSASEEQKALAELADAVVPGPDGVLRLLERLAHDIAHA